MLTIIKPHRYPAGKPVSQSRAVRMIGVRGFMEQMVAAMPDLGIGKTTGVRYIRNCISSGKPFPISV